MRKYLPFPIFVVGTFCFFFLLFLGCAPDPRVDPEGYQNYINYQKEQQKNSETVQLNAFFSGDHILRKVTEKSEKSTYVSGSYFLFMGGFSGETSEEFNVMFAWKMNDGTYAISKVPLGKVRVKIDDNCTTPTIAFNYACDYPDSEWIVDNRGVQETIDRFVRYMTITCHPSMWPTDIQMPMNKKENK